MNWLSQSIKKSCVYFIKFIFIDSIQHLTTHSAELSHLFRLNGVIKSENEVYFVSVVLPTVFPFSYYLQKNMRPERIRTMSVEKAMAKMYVPTIYYIFRTTDEWHFSWYTQCELVGLICGFFQLFSCPDWIFHLYWFFFGTSGLGYINSVFCFRLVNFSVFHWIDGIFLPFDMFFSPFPIESCNEIWIQPL